MRGICAEYEPCLKRRRPLSLSDSIPRRRGRGGRRRRRRDLDGRRYSPPTAISSIRSAGTFTEPPNGTQRASRPAAVTAFSIAWRLEAIVNSSAGGGREPPPVRPAGGPA